MRTLVRDCHISVRWIYHLVDDSLSWRTVSGDAGSGQYWQAYCTEFINPAMGFTIGWVNWLGGAITITTQIVASAIIMKNIIPSVSTFVWILLFAAILFGANFFAAGKYGNVSFYFASLKIVLIIAFVLVGAGLLLRSGCRRAGRPGQLYCERRLLPERTCRCWGCISECFLRIRRNRDDRGNCRRDQKGRGYPESCKLDAVLASGCLCRCNDGPDRAAALGSGRSATVPRSLMYSVMRACMEQSCLLIFSY